MIKFTEDQLDWLCEQIPDPVRSPKGERQPEEKRQVLRGIFWVLDNGAKWKALPTEFGPKSTVYSVV
jgi:transposase